MEIQINFLPPHPRTCFFTSNHSPFQKKLRRRFSHGSILVGRDDARCVSQWFQWKYLEWKRLVDSGSLTLCVIPFLYYAKYC